MMERLEIEIIWRTRGICCLKLVILGDVCCLKGFSDFLALITGCDRS